MEVKALLDVSNQTAPVMEISAQEKGSSTWRLELSAQCGLVENGDLLWSARQSEPLVVSSGTNQTCLHNMIQMERLIQSDIFILKTHMHLYFLATKTTTNENYLQENGRKLQVERSKAGMMISIS